MSHHLDSPLARQDPRLDISDVYLFRGDVGTVFVMNVDPCSGGGGFHPEGVYEFNVDTDGDARQDITFRFRFDPIDEDGRQSFELRRLDGPDAGDRDAAGRVLATGRTEEEVAGDGVRVEVGPAADPFFIDGTVVGAVATTVATGVPLDLGTWDPASAANAFAGTNVGSIVLEVSDEVLGVPSISFWATTALATDAGGWQQINRCAQPLVNTLFHPDDTDDASAYNTTHPCDDRATYGPRVQRLAAAAVAAMGWCDDPEEHGRRVSELLFPDVLRYELGTPASFGFGVRNGRGLVDPVAEVMFALVLNRPVPMGIDARAATGTARGGFPYLSPPVPEPTATA